MSASKWLFSHKYCLNRLLLFSFILNERHFAQGQNACANLTVREVDAGTGSLVNVTVSFTVYVNVHTQHCSTSARPALVTVAVKGSDKLYPTVCQFLPSCLDTPQCSCPDKSEQEQGRYRYNATRRLSVSAKEVWLISVQLQNDEWLSHQVDVNVTDHVPSATETPAIERPSPHASVLNTTTTAVTTTTATIRATTTIRTSQRTSTLPITSKPSALKDNNVSSTTASTSSAGSTDFQIQADKSGNHQGQQIWPAVVGIIVTGVVCFIIGFKVKGHRIVKSETPESAETLDSSRLPSAQQLLMCTDDKCGLYSQVDVVTLINSPTADSICNVDDDGYLEPSLALQQAHAQQNNGCQPRSLASHGSATGLGSQV